MSKLLAAILAGGKGKRMGVLCQVRPKPAIPFAGKYKMIDFNLSNSVHSRVDEAVIFVDYQRTNLVNYIKRWQQANQLEIKLDILSPQNTSYHGTANALYQHVNFLRQNSADYVLVMPSDHVYKMDYGKMLAFHEKLKADVTVSIIPVPADEASRFGILSIEDDGRVSDYQEKPVFPQSNLASMGVYIFNKDILIRRLEEDAADPDSIHDFGYSIIDRMVRQDRAFAYKYNGFWRDIGTINTYYTTSMELVSKQIPMSLDGYWPILTAPDNSESIIKFPCGSMDNSIISPGCIIKGRVENSILSPGVFIGEQAIVRNSILMSNVFVGDHSVVESCVADEDVNIGKYCYIGFGLDHHNNTSCSILGMGSAVAPHVAIAHGSRVAPFMNLNKSITVVTGGESEEQKIARALGQEQSLQFLKFNQVNKIT